MTFTFTQTHSGIDFDIAHPKAENVSFSDIAEQLAKLCRFAGATQTFYSVAQHSVLVADFVSPPAVPYALLHDAHEAYLGDWTSPVKCIIATDKSRQLENNVASAIHQAAGLEWPVPEPVASEVRGADMSALATERKCLMVDNGTPWNCLGGVEPFPVTIRSWAWPDAAMKLSAAFADAGIVIQTRRAG